MPDGRTCRNELDRARLITTVKCGRPEPHAGIRQVRLHDAVLRHEAAISIRCPIRSTLQQREIERVADFLFRK